MSVPNSASSRRPLLSPNKVAPANDGQGIVKNGAFFRDATSLSTNDIQYNSLLDKEGQATEETFYEVEISNPELSRKASRSELASKSQCLTRRWQTALVSTIILLALGGGIGKCRWNRLSVCDHCPSRRIGLLADACQSDYATLLTLRWKLLHEFSILWCDTYALVSSRQMHLHR